tara:strand:- start:1323 stop:1985 length:663 start_codon:yes stop_codon:yes gene_type:complete
MLNKLKRKLFVISVLIITVSILVGCSSTAPEFSTFNSNDDGWTAYGDSQTSTPTYHSSNGNPGGHLSVDDSVVGGVWYWLAPSNYLGNKSHYYGKYLKFDLKQSDTSNQFAYYDVMLISTDGTTLIYYDESNRATSQPATVWTPYIIKLDTTANWRVEPEQGISYDDENVFKNEFSQADLATVVEIKSVLGSLDKLYIRGEFRTGEDTGSLDNVYFGSSS